MKNLVSPRDCAKNFSILYRYRRRIRVPTRGALRYLIYVEGTYRPDEFDFKSRMEGKLLSIDASLGTDLQSKEFLIKRLGCRRKYDIFSVRVEWRNFQLRRNIIRINICLNQNSIACTR